MQKALELPQTFRYLYCANYKDMTNIIENPVTQPYVSREEKNGLTQELLHSIFEYKDGKLYWKIKRRKSEIGEEAGYLSYRTPYPNYKFICINYNSQIYKRSRLVFMYHHGWLPPIVDHENRNPLDDNIKNLRPATSAQNSANVTKKPNTSSKYLGVCWEAKRNRWSCTLSKNNVIIHGKRSKTQEEAALRYNQLAVKYHGEFANLNIISPPQNTKES